MADVESKDSGSIKPTVIMKVDGPTEDCTNKQDEAPENEEHDEFTMCSPQSVIKTTTSNPFASDYNKFGRGILKPSQLVVNSSPVTSKIVFRPSSFNVFSKTSDENKSDSELSKTNGEVKFVPLKSDSKKTESTEPKPANSTLSTSAAVPTFIFGQNLKDRIVGDGKGADPAPSTSLSTNGTCSDGSDMLFSSALKNEGKTDTPKEKECKSLTESAREYEESRANKRKYEEVEVKTGEEDEMNILHISCKLFAFDKASSNWQERGRGTLRLNDFEIDNEHSGSRIVFRTTGSLRVILNTKIWAEMTIDKASEKSIRLTALDSNGEIKVFLIMASIEDTRHLYSELQLRLQKELTGQKRKKINLDTENK